MNGVATGHFSNAELDAQILNIDEPDGARVIEDVYKMLGRFVCYPSEHAHVAHALWILHAHLMTHWDTTPRIAFLSPEPASGKSRALELTAHLVPNAVEAINVTPAYLFRKIGAEGGVTVCYDEIDTVFGPKAKDNEEIRGLLNAGHRRGAVAGRCVVRGKTIETEEIPAYSAVALAGLGWLPETILSRSIVVRMKRRRKDQTIEGFRQRINGPQAVALRGKIERWAASAAPVLPDDLPPEIQDRDADVWEALIAVADLIGGDWPGRAIVAAKTLVAVSKEIEPSLGIRLLGDCKIAFGNLDVLASRALLDELIKNDEAPWGDMHGKPLDPRGLAKRLREYEIRPCNIRIGHSPVVKGYRRRDFAEAWESYLPPPPDKSATAATALQPTETEDDTDDADQPESVWESDLPSKYVAGSSAS